MNDPQLAIHILISLMTGQAYTCAERTASGCWIFEPAAHRSPVWRVKRAI